MLWEQSDRTVQSWKYTRIQILLCTRRQRIEKRPTVSSASSSGALGCAAGTGRCRNATVRWTVFILRWCDVNLRQCGGIPRDSNARHVLHFSKRKATSTRYYTPYLTFGSELWRAGWETSSSIKAEQSRSAISRRVSSFWFCARKLNRLRDFKAKHQAANTTRSQLWNRRVVKLKGDNDSPMVLTNAHTATTRTAKERAGISHLRSEQPTERSSTTGSRKSNTSLF